MILLARLAHLCILFQKVLAWGLYWSRSPPMGATASCGGVTEASTGKRRPASSTCQASNHGIFILPSDMLEKHIERNHNVKSSE